jgi:diguanylate cyclase (GGDEF)-like protein
MGGDEFVLVFSGARPGEISSKFEQIRAVVTQVSHEMFSGELLNVSIGNAQYPEDGSDAEELLSVADRRMYAEKAAHRQQIATVSRVVRERERPGAVLVH